MRPKFSQAAKVGALRFDRHQTQRGRMSLLLTFITSLMLGMRHATDPDHIVAVTTIVSR